MWLDYCGRLEIIKWEGRVTICQTAQFTLSLAVLTLFKLCKCGCKSLHSNTVRTHAFFHMCIVGLVWMCIAASRCIYCSEPVQSHWSSWQIQVFWRWAEAAFDLSVRLKIEMLWVGLFLEYTFKTIQNIQWSKGEHWPWLHLSFINFLSVKWALSERTAWLCNRSRAIHKGETRSLWFWFTGTHLSFRVCGVVWKEGILLQP